MGVCEKENIQKEGGWGEEGAVFRNMQEKGGRQKKRINNKDEKLGVGGGGRGFERECVMQQNKNKPKTTDTKSTTLHHKHNSNMNLREKPHGKPNKIYKVSNVLFVGPHAIENIQKDGNKQTMEGSDCV